MGASSSRRSRHGPLQSGNPRIRASYARPPGHPGYDYLFKFLLVGDTGAGKTSIRDFYIEGRKVEPGQPPLEQTTDVDGKEKLMECSDGIDIKLSLWEEHKLDHRPMNKPFYRGSKAIIVVFDISNRQSFDNVWKWLLEVDRSADENVHKLLIANKADLRHNEGGAASTSLVQPSEIEALAQRSSVPYVETSALTGQGIVEAIDKLALRIREREED